jgi:murein DD-endopeptidase MepM/ murein hydrolase activator NlpD
MPVGTMVSAARAGVVADIRVDFRDSQRGENEANWVRIRHADGTIASYVHLTERGALVKIGDVVVAGQPIGLSGNTGNTSRWPHLHFHVRRCSSCGTSPVTFRNTEPNPEGLVVQRFYLALPYETADGLAQNGQ